MKSLGDRPALALAAAALVVGLAAFGLASRPAVVSCDAYEEVAREGTFADLDRLPLVPAFADRLGPFAIDRPTPSKYAMGVTAPAQRLRPDGACHDPTFPLPVAVPNEELFLAHDEARDRYIVVQKPKGTRRHPGKPSAISVLSVRRAAGNRLRVPEARMTHFAMGLGALSVLCAIAAPLRRRRARRYASLHRAWKEAVLAPDGRLQREDGSAIGVLDRGRARWAGPVLVSPDALTSATAFRDGVVVATRDVIAGGHALHARQAAAALRDARWLTAFTFAGAAFSFVCARLA